MRIALIYPPPWKVAASGESAPLAREGAPEGYRQGDLDADFYQVPYGLLCLGAEARRAGHQVKLLNLSSYPWSKVEEIVATLDAELWGMSCWTANRRGVSYVAEAIKRHHPKSTVVVGGPHATPLARELLEHHGSIDLVCRGESDETFLEIASRLTEKKPLSGIAGTAYREKKRAVLAPERPKVAELDVLANVQRHYATHILMTSRGCPWACTFCGAESSWGRGFRAHSVERTLEQIEAALEKLPVKMIQIKDDTFTTNKKRVIELCRAIRARGLRFLWSCDTRVDLLTEELLVEMRLAGCQRLSLGVESGSQRILDAIDKKITVEEIVKSTELAKSVGIKVRHYMMLGNRGETMQSFEETLAFLERARPHEYIFSCLSVYPGTRDYEEAKRQGWLDPVRYFRERFQEYKVPFDAEPAVVERMNAWFAEHAGLQTLHRPSVAEARAVLDKIGEHHAAHLDLASTLLEAGEPAEAEVHAKRALELGYPCPGVAYNLLACIAKARGDLDGMMDSFSAGAKLDPQHWVLIQNVNRARAWFKERGPERGLPLELDPRCDFQLLERTLQPTLPGPLPEGWQAWESPPEPEPGALYVKTPDVEGSGLGLGKKLTVI